MFCVGVVLFWAFWGSVVGVSAQEVAPHWAGRLDSSYSWVADPLPNGSHTLGTVKGWTGLTAGTKDVKSEVRLGFSNLPQPQVDLTRAWAKFRFPGVRFTTGLGRLAWGPGFVYVPGDLLFDSTSTDVDWGSEELRTSGAWLADVWASLGDEAFAEAAVVGQSVGARVSAAPGGVTIEAAGAWDNPHQKAKAALSTQFHAALDWYSTLRWDSGGELGQFSGSLGTFGVWTLVESTTLSTRHEVLVSAPDFGRQWKSYHDLTLAFEGGWSLTGRLLGTKAMDPWLGSAEVRWGPLQNLSLYASTALQAPWSARAGVLTRW